MTLRDNIFFAFHGRLVGSKFMQQCVVDILAKMPQDIQDHITQHCWFVSSMEDAFGFTLTGNDLANQHLVFLSDDLFQQDINQIYYTIAHEIGHVMLGHKNSVLTQQTQQEIAQQEQEADAFAKKFI